jgi:energy-coupling factor transporter transmembrane protein EcfT
MPFLLALFRLGDEVVLALESRGVGYNRNPTSAMRLKWGMRDFGLTIGALALAIGLWLLAHR